MKRQHGVLGAFNDIAHRPHCHGLSQIEQSFGKNAPATLQRSES
jgi:hypothetical protein